MGGRGSKGGKGRGGAKPQMSPTGAGPLVIVNKDIRQALGAKGEPMSIREAQVGSNPNWTPPNGRLGDDAYSANCQRCVVAYEMRRRGYDVEALPIMGADDPLSGTGFLEVRPSQNGGLEPHMQFRMQGAFRHGRMEFIGTDPSIYNPADSADRKTLSIINSPRWPIMQIERKMKEWGDGSRAVVAAKFKGQGGHVFNVENANGNIIFIDSQTGYGLTHSEFKKRIGEAIDVGNMHIMRTDNLRVSGRISKFVTTVR